MGFISSFLCVFLPGVGAATYFSFSLGSRLPIACRKMGQRIGLGYGVFKAILKLNLPKDIVKSNEFIKLMRQTEQQANALNRELKTSLHKIKQEIKEQIPDEIKKNPHLSLQLKDYRKSNQNSSQNQLYGSSTILDAFEERNRLKQAKAQKDRLTGFTKSL